MKQDDLWNDKYEQIVQFLETNHRRPSKYDLEDHAMLNWIKYNKKLLKRGKLTPERRMKLAHLLDMCSKYQRINQFQYKDAEMNVSAKRRNQTGEKVSYG